MEGEMISGAPRVVINGGDQCRKVRKLFFVPQEADEFNSAEFTVCVDVTVQQMGFKHAAPKLSDGRAHPQTRHAGQRGVSKSMSAHNVDAITQRAHIRYEVIQSSITNTAPNFLPVAHMAADPVGVPKQAFGAFQIALSEGLAKLRTGDPTAGRIMDI